MTSASHRSRRSWLYGKNNLYRQIWNMASTKGTICDEPLRRSSLNVEDFYQRIFVIVVVTRDNYRRFIHTFVRECPLKNSQEIQTFGDAFYCKSSVNIIIPPKKKNHRREIFIHFFWRGVNNFERCWWFWANCVTKRFSRQNENYSGKFPSIPLIFITTLLNSLSTSITPNENLAPCLHWHRSSTANRLLSAGYASNISGVVLILSLENLKLSRRLATCCSIIFYCFVSHSLFVSYVHWIYLYVMYLQLE